MKNQAMIAALNGQRQQDNDLDVGRILSDPSSRSLPARELARQVAQARVAGYGVGIDAAVDAALDAFEARLLTAVYLLTNIDTRDRVQDALRRES